MSAIDNFKQELDRRVAEWEKLGVLVGGERLNRQVTDMLRIPRERHPTTLKEDTVIHQLIRTHARQLKRPYVTAFEQKQVVDKGAGPRIKYAWRVSIPATKRCQVLSAAFKLVSIEAAPATLEMLEAAPIITYPPNRKWVSKPSTNSSSALIDLGESVIVKSANDAFYIQDKAHYDHWMKRVREDDEFRKALGTLPAEVSGEVK